MLPAPVSLAPVPPLPDRPLPDRPRLRHPALHRAPDVLQFGVDPVGALVVEGLTPPLVRMVDALDGSRSPARWVAEAAAAGASPHAARGLLEDLHAAGLLAAPDRPGALAERRVVVRGAGRVAVAVACLLAAAGVGRVLVEAEGTVRGADVGTGLLTTDVGRPARFAVEDAVTRAAGGPPAPRAPAARGWLTARADLVVLADTARPDPVAAARLVLDGRAHLPVAVVDGVGVVGPLVVPGATPCLRCEDLARAEDDPAWPRLAAELAVRRTPVTVTPAAEVAVVAVTEALAALAPDGDDAPETRGATLALRADGTRDRTPARRHPDCGCDVLAGRAHRRGRPVGGDPGDGSEVTSGVACQVTDPVAAPTAGAA